MVALIQNPLSFLQRAAWLLVLLMALSILMNCGGSRSPRSSYGVDWNRFDYRRSEQIGRDNDQDYRLPRTQEPCLRDGITGEVFCDE